MSSSERIAAAAVFIIAAAFAGISIRSFRNKGFLLNNASYIYASAKEREAMDKKPYYRQSAIVFLLLSFVFLVIGLSIVFADAGINLLEIPLILAAVIYAVVSLIQTGKRERQQDHR